MKDLMTKLIQAIGILVGIFVVIIILVAINDKSTKSKTPEQITADACRDESYSYLVSQMSIKQKIKSPSTAKFSSNYKHTFTGNCVHTFVGYLDSQNGFGAMVRTNYTTTVQYNIKTRKYKLTKIVLK